MKWTQKLAFLATPLIFSIQNVGACFTVGTSVPTYKYSPDLFQYFITNQIIFFIWFIVLFLWWLYYEWNEKEKRLNSAESLLTLIHIIYVLILGFGAIFFSSLGWIQMMLLLGILYFIVLFFKDFFLFCKERFTDQPYVCLGFWVCILFFFVSFVPLWYLKELKHALIISYYLYYLLVYGAMLVIIPYFFTDKYSFKISALSILSLIIVFVLQWFLTANGFLPGISSSGCGF